MGQIQISVREVLLVLRVWVRVNGSCKSFKTSESHGVILVSCGQNKYLCILSQSLPILTVLNFLLQILGSLGVGFCPSCSNNKSFKIEMVVNGIYFAETKFILPKPHANQEHSSKESRGVKQIQSSADTRWALVSVSYKENVFLKFLIFLFDTDGSLDRSS